MSKKSANIHSNGVEGTDDGIPGVAACDGADRFWLQAEQCSLTARMSLVIPGQNTIDLARDSMDDSPWCAEWRIRWTLSRRDRGTTTQSRYKMTPLRVTLSESRCVQNAAISSFAARRSSGKPSWIVSRSRRMVGSHAVSVAMRCHDMAKMSCVACCSEAAIALSASSISEWSDRLLSSANSLTDDGWRDVASAAKLVLPGRCAMSNDHGSVRCLWRNIRVLEISSNVRSPRILTKGLWSVTTSRSLHPCVKYLDSSSPQATARVSPSIGA